VIPTYVVIPVKDQLPLTRNIVAQLGVDGGYERLFVLDNGSTDGTTEWLALQQGRGRLEAVTAPDLGIYALWNLGVRLARDRTPECNVAIFNNDLRIGPRLVVRLAAGLRSAPDLWAVSPNYDRRSIEGVQYVRSTFKRQGLAGFAFMARGEIFDTVAFDQGFAWWYGDDDFVAGIEAQGGRVGIVGDTTVEHIGGGAQTVRYTRDTLTAIERDRRRMWAKWSHF